MPSFLRGNGQLLISLVRTMSSESSSVPLRAALKGVIQRIEAARLQRKQVNFA